MRLFFQHQSVGENLLTGLRELATRGAAIPLIADIGSQPADDKSGQLLCSRAGTNGDGVSKLHAFADSLTQIDTRCDYAMLKFCYVDIVDVDQARRLYERYSEIMARIREAHAELRLAHCTVPLRQLPMGPYALTRRLLGHRHPEFARNGAREWFNERLRADRDSERIFDLAAIESTLPEGRRCTQFLDSTRTPGLIPAYTSDGGHLNEVGRAVVATAFMQFFKGLPDTLVPAQSQFPPPKTEEENLKFL